MAHSRRKTPVRGITSADSEKKDKQLAHRRYRRKVKVAVGAESDLLPHEKELSNPWSMDKDGKVRFNPKKRPKAMRK